MASLQLRFVHFTPVSTVEIYRWSIKLHLLYRNAVTTVRDHCSQTGSKEFILFQKAMFWQNTELYNIASIPLLGIVVVVVVVVVVEVP